MELLAEHTVCTAGQKLTPHQATVLRIFGQRQAEFSVFLRCCWHRQGMAHLFRDVLSIGVYACSHRSVCSVK